MTTKSLILVRSWTSEWSCGNGIAKYIKIQHKISHRFHIIFLLLDEPMPDTQLLPDFCQHPITDDHYSRLAGQCQCHGKEWPKGKEKTSRALGPHQHEHILQLTSEKCPSTWPHASNDSELETNHFGFTELHMSLESTLWTPNLHSHVSATEIASMRLVYLCRFEDFFLPLSMLQPSTVVYTNSCAFWNKSLSVWHLRS